MLHEGEKTLDKWLEWQQSLNLNEIDLSLDRINAVNSKLKDTNGNRHIFVSKSCKTLIKGLQRQTYKEDTNIPDKEDGFDHMNDALGYLIDYINPCLLYTSPSPRD